MNLQQGKTSKLLIIVLQPIFTLFLLAKGKSFTFYYWKITSFSKTSFTDIFYYLSWFFYYLVDQKLYYLSSNLQSKGKKIEFNATSAAKIYCAVTHGYAVENSYFSFILACIQNVFN